MPQNEFAAIPDPSTAPESLREAVLALKQNVEVLLGRRGTDGTTAMLVEDGLAATDVVYDTVNSDLGVFTVQDAIDTLAAGTSAAAEDVTYDNSGSGLAATDVQAAIDELADDLAVPAFLAFNSSTDSNVTGDGTQVTVDVDTELFDTGSDFSGDTFTAPVDGVYFFHGTIALSGVGAGHIMDLRLITSNRNHNVVYCDLTNIDDGSNFVNIGWSTMENLTAGQTAFVRLTVSGGAKTIDVIGSSPNLNTWFGGYLVRTI